MREMSLGRIQPDYLVYYEHGDVVVVGVKLPCCVGSSQIISDNSKCGLQLKSIIDSQIEFGTKKPMTLGVVVQGYDCRTFYCIPNKEAA